jgi:hypothetical protein
MDVTTITGTAAPPVVPEFLTGQHVKLRPVLESDLPSLAQLMAEAPHGFSWNVSVWTESSLRKQFNDDKEPGLWGRDKRYLVVTDFDGVVCGLLMEGLQRLGGATVEFHIADARADRDVLGSDALAVYKEYKRSWFNCPRIEVFIVAVEDAKREWLRSSGFELEIECKESWLYQGEVATIEVWAWIADWVLANRAADGVGE